MPQVCVPDAQHVFLQDLGGCSNVTWTERVADVRAREAPVVYVNVGANKGYRVPEFLSLWSQQPVPGHMKGWQKHLLEYARLKKSRFLKMFSCGNCGDCNAELPSPHSRTGAKMHLLELATVNQALLRHMLRETKLDPERVALHAFGASNVTQHLPVFKGLMAGEETGSVLTGKKARRLANASATTMVPAVALDDFFRQQRLEQIYHVAIDTEGVRLWGTRPAALPGPVGPPHPLPGLWSPPTSPIF
jgi:hypothetical protein